MMNRRGISKFVSDECFAAMRDIRDHNKIRSKTRQQKDGS